MFGVNAVDIAVKAAFGIFAAAVPGIPFHKTIIYICRDKGGNPAEKRDFTRQNGYFCRFRAFVLKRAGNKGIM